MDSKKQSDNKIPAIRTYAADLENNRKTPSVKAEEKFTSVKEASLSEKNKVTIDKQIIVKPTEHKVVNKSSEETGSLPPLSSIKFNKRDNKAKVVSASPKETSFIVDEGSGNFNATIITDTKRDRFKLFPSIIKSISNWFLEKKEAYELRKVPRYSVPETTRRKGVIQKATGKTGKLTTSDFSSIQERIRKRKEEDEKPEQTTTWSAKTEPFFLLLENPEKTKISNVQLVPRKSFRNAPVESTQPEEKKLETKEVAPKIPVPDLTKEEIVPPAVIPPPPKVAEAQIEPVKIEEPEIVENYESNESNEIAVPEEISLVKPEAKNEPFRLLNLNTNLLATGIFGLIFAFIILVIYLYFVLTSPNIYVSKDISLDTAPVLMVPIKFVAVTNNDKSSILKALEFISKDNSETTQVGLLFSGSKTTLIPTQILITILEFSLDKQLSQAISQLRLGYTASNNPYMVMKISDPIVAKGGMLDWEKRMPDNLADIFNFSKTVLVNSKFIDGSFEGIDVRILKNPAGLDIIVYGIRNNVIVVASNTADFSELVNLVK